MTTKKKVARKRVPKDPAEQKINSKQLITGSLSKPGDEAGTINPDALSSEVNGEESRGSNAEVVSDGEDFAERERQEVVIVSETGDALPSVVRPRKARAVLHGR